MKQMGCTPDAPDGGLSQGRVEAAPPPRRCLASPSLLRYLGRPQGHPWGCGRLWRWKARQVPAGAWGPAARRAREHRLCTVSALSLHCLCTVSAQQDESFPCRPLASALPSLTPRPVCLSGGWPRAPSRPLCGPSCSWGPISIPHGVTWGPISIPGHAGHMGSHGVTWGLMGSHVHPRQCPR